MTLPRGQLDGGPLGEGQTGVHVVCHDCPFEGLVLPLAAIDQSVRSRGGRLAREHAEMERHRCSAMEVEG